MSLPRYPEYKDSGVEWLGEVPAHWVAQPLLAVVRECSDSNRRMLEDNLLSLSYGKIIRKDINANDGLLPASFDTYQIVREDDLVLRLTDLQNDQRSLRSAIVHESGIITSAYLAIRPVAVVPHYLHYLLRTYDRKKVFYSMGGGLRQSMKFSDLKRLPILLPSDAEQATITSFLDRETATIDALVAEQERLIELLKEKRQAVISHAVTKGLDPDVPMKDSGVEWLGAVPAHWIVSQLRRVVRDGTSVTYGIVQAGPDVEGGVPYIRTGDMSGDTLPVEGYLRTSSEIDAAYSRSKVAAGDLVIAIRASVGKCLPVPPELDGANLTQGTARISPGGLTDAAFLLAYMNSRPIQTLLDARSKGATFKEITLETLRKTPVLLPSRTEQEEISKWVRIEGERFTELIAVAECATTLLNERRSALISAAITGQIDVRGLVEAEVA